MNFITTKKIELVGFNRGQRRAMVQNALRTHMLKCLNEDTKMEELPEKDILRINDSEWKTILHCMKLTSGEIIEKSFNDSEKSCSDFKRQADVLPKSANLRWEIRQDFPSKILEKLPPISDRQGNPLDFSTDRDKRQCLATTATTIAITEIAGATAPATTSSTTSKTSWAIKLFPH